MGPGFESPMAHQLSHRRTFCGSAYGYFYALFAGVAEYFHTAALVAAVIIEVYSVDEGINQGCPEHGVIPVATLEFFKEEFHLIEG